MIDEMNTCAYIEKKIQPYQSAVKMCKLHKTYGCVAALWHFEFYILKSTVWHFHRRHSNLGHRAMAQVVFLPRPEIIYINTPFSLPRPEVTVKSQKYRDLYYNSNLNITWGKMQKHTMLFSKISNITLI